jgi:DNA-binding NarL/FixJ family response regulator
MEQSSGVQAPDEIALNHSELIAFLNQLDGEFSEKNPHMSANEFKIFAWAKLRFMRFVFYSNVQPKNMDNTELLILKQLHLQGFSYRDIAFVLDRSLGSIEAHVHSFGTKEQLLKEISESF